ncbi:MAG: polysaccharide biosynthesis tyrosine autokinase [Planctomycetota bacterium]
MDIQPSPQGQGPTQFVFAPPEQDEPSFDFWGVLSRRKWLVFLGLVVGLAAGGIYNSQTPTIYKSTARIRIEPKDPPKLNLGDDPYGQLANFELRHDKLIGEFNVVSPCIFDNELDTIPTLREIGQPEKKVKYVQDGLSITQNREENTLYEVEYYSKNSEDARVILSALILTYEKQLTREYEDSKADIKELLDRWTFEFTEAYKAKKAELEQVRADVPKLIVGTGGLDQHQVKLRELQDALPGLKSRLQGLNKIITSANNAIDGGEESAKNHVWLLIQEGKIKAEDKLPQQNRAQLERIEANIFDHEMRLRELEERYGSGHYKVQSMKTSLNDLVIKKGELEDQAENVRRLPPIEMLRLFIDRQMEELNIVRNNIRTNLEELEFHGKKAALISQNNTRIEDLEKELARYRDRADIAQDQFIQITSDEKQNNKQQGFRFTITEDASLGEKVWPVLPIILGIGALAGTLLGFGVGCLVELADKTFHNPDQIIQQLQVPLIGHVPVIGQSKRYLVENSLIEPIVCTYHRPKSQVSEAFRAVRTALYFNTQGSQHSVIQVTSPTPGDGKSTLASNLAVSIAQSGKRVLLVDADMRRPRQHATFGISSKVGFATVLSGQSEWRDTMFECEEIEGLTVMPCGAKPQNPAELSSSPQVKLLIEEMRQEFDFVIIDTPPLLAVTDPCPIAARVDGVILCLRIKKNVRVSAERAVELISNLGAQCIGLVVNGVGAQSGYGSQYTYGAYRAGYSYNGYGYGYGYGYGGGKYYDEDQKGRVAQPRRIEGQTTEP